MVLLIPYQHTLNSNQSCAVGTWDTAWQDFIFQQLLWKKNKNIACITGKMLKIKTNNVPWKEKRNREYKNSPDNAPRVAIFSNVQSFYQNFVFLVKAFYQNYVSPYFHKEQNGIEIWSTLIDLLHQIITFPIHMKLYMIYVWSLRPKSTKFQWECQYDFSFNG